MNYSKREYLAAVMTLFADNPDADITDFLNNQEDLVNLFGMPYNQIISTLIDKSAVDMEYIETLGFLTGWWNESDAPTYFTMGHSQLCREEYEKKLSGDYETKGGCRKWMLAITKAFNNFGNWFDSETQYQDRMVTMTRFKTDWLFRDTPGKKRSRNNLTLLDILVKMKN